MTEVCGKKQEIDESVEFLDILVYEIYFDYVF
jgi:hypothetical protein